MLRRVVGIVCLILSAQAESQKTVAQGAIPEFGQVGTGPDTVLIIPCMSCRWTVWNDFMTANAAKYTFFAITPPGFGGWESPGFVPRDSADTPWRTNLQSELSAFVDRQKIRRAIVIGHSWGVSVASQFAANRPDVTAGFVALDSWLESASWWPDAPTRYRQAASLRADSRWVDSSAGAWASFNSVGLPPDSIFTRAQVRNYLGLYGAFMATSRDALFGYWREGLLVDLTANTKAVRAPILDVTAIMPNANADSVQRAHLKSLEVAGIGAKVHTVFLPNTVHHLQLHRPIELARILDEFAATLKRK